MICRSIADTTAGLPVRRITVREGSNPIRFRSNMSFREIYISGEEKSDIWEAGDLFILHPGLDYDLLREKKTECDNIGMIFAGKNVEEILRIFQLDQTEYVHIGNTDRWLALCQKMRDYIADGSSLEIGETNVGISFEIFQMISDEKNRSPIPPDICRIISIMEEHIDKPISIQDLAKSFGMSLPTLNAKFREYLHRTPYQHLIHLRMQRALSRLETTASIKEIASRCGYPTPFHFSAGFKRCCGLSPLRYRREKLNIFL